MMNIPTPSLGQHVFLAINMCVCVCACMLVCVCMWLNAYAN